MILCYLHCLENNIDFSLFDKNGKFSPKHDWLEFFEPFCPIVEEQFHSKYNMRDHFGDMSYKQILKEIVLFSKKGDKDIPAYKRLTLRLFGDRYKKKHAFNYYTYELFATARFDRDASATISLDNYNIHGNLQHACQHLINKTWKYNTQTAEEVNQLQKSITLPSEYIGFHIRGGDKFSEYELQTVEEYINLAETRTAIKNVFVLTDDYTVIENLEKKYPLWNFYTLCNKNERGYFHKEFLKKNKAEIRAAHIKLFASMDLLAGAELFVGTFSSNPGMYLGMRMDEGKSIGVDFEKWFIW